MTPATDGPLHLANRLLPIGEPVVVTAPAPVARPSWVESRTLVAALVLLGSGLRLVPMLQNRNLWIDEAMLGLNLVERSPQQLLKPLDWNQAAPVGFLLTVAATMMSFGTSEWAMRLFPFIGSMLGLIGFAWIAPRMPAPAAATLGIALFAISPHLVDYSAECQQYATDAALAVGIFAAGLSLLQGAGGFRRWAVFAGVGAAAVWFSHPVAFVLGGVGGAIFLDALVKKDRMRILACLGMIACWLTSFALCYFLFVAQLGNNQFLLDYWAGHFLPLPPKELGDVTWLADHFFGPIGYPGGLGGTEVKAGGIAAVLLAVGVAGFWRERWPIAVALVVPGVLALFASGVHMYPFAGRLLLFLVPMLLLGVARGAWAVGSTLWPTQKVAAVSSRRAVYRRCWRHTSSSAARRDRSRSRKFSRTFARGCNPATRCICTTAAPPRSSSTRATIRSRRGLFAEHRANRTEYRDELQQFAGQPRVWLVFSHRHLAEESLCGRMPRAGRVPRELQRPGATAFLFDFRKPKAPE